MNYFIYPYKSDSKSARLLAKALNGKLIKHKNSKFVLEPHKVVINWGAVDFPAKLIGPNTLNQNVSFCADKKKTLQLLEVAGVRCPQFTTSVEQVEEWLCEGGIVFARKYLNSSNGKGIVIIREDDPIPDAPLYTRYVKKQEEYRVHVMKGQPFYCQQKLKKNDHNPHLIRNSANGYVYTSQNIVMPAEAASLAFRAVNALNLDFGAVDLIYNKKKDKCYVLEVNSAPGIENNSVAAYSEVIQNAFDQ